MGCSSSKVSSVGKGSGRESALEKESPTKEGAAEEHKVESEAENVEKIKKDEALARSKSLNEVVDMSPTRRKNAINCDGQVMRWKKGELIGCGSYGKVYIGLNESSGILMAVKEVKASSEMEVEALQAEISLMRSLRHENIVQYLGSEADPQASILYIFTEWVPGGSISNILQKFGRLTESVVRNYTMQLLKGLSYLHRRGIIHRDIKCANILVDDRGTIKLADFGASKVLGVGTSSMVAGNQSLRGTPYYMAPEIIMQTGHGRKADIWSVGCTVLHMISGKPPWKSMRFGSISALMYHICNTREAPPMPEETISPELRSFLMICFQRDPSERPSSSSLIQHPFVRSETDDERQVQQPQVQQIQQRQVFVKAMPIQQPHASSPSRQGKPSRKVVIVTKNDERGEDSVSGEQIKQGEPMKQCSKTPTSAGLRRKVRIHCEPQLRVSPQKYASKTPTSRRVSQSPSSAINNPVLRSVRSASNLKALVQQDQSKPYAKPLASPLRHVDTVYSQHHRGSGQQQQYSLTQQSMRQARKPAATSSTSRVIRPAQPDPETSRFLSTVVPNNIPTQLPLALDWMEQIDDIDDDGHVLVNLKVPELDEMEVTSYLQNKAKETEQWRDRSFNLRESDKMEMSNREGEENEWTLRENTIINTYEAHKIRTEEKRHKAAIQQVKQAEKAKWDQELAAELEFQRRNGLRT